MINKITITGADDHTDINDMIRISKQFPLVEWGILFSKNRQGTQRYPSYEWVRKLREVLPDYPLNLSAHLCGNWTKDIFQGKFSWIVEETGYLMMFQRLQLNFNCQANPYNLAKFVSLIQKYPDYQFILQENKSNELFNREVRSELENIAFLYDSSGGRGTPIQIPPPRPIMDFYTGYAGGLNPDNVLDMVGALAPISNSVNVWIDVETGVRTNDVLDMVKVEEFLTNATNK